MNTTNFVAGCDMVESVNMTKSYNIPSKGNELYPVSSTNLSETRELTENEAILLTSPKIEIKSDVINSAVDNSGENVEKPITTTDSKSKDKGCLSNEDTEMRVNEEGGTGNQDTDITKKTADYGCVFFAIKHRIEF